MVPNSPWITCDNQNVNASDKNHRKIVLFYHAASVAREQSQMRHYPWL
jgi:hypothetical protein